MLDFITQLKNSISTKAQEGVEFVSNNAWKVKTIPYYLEDNARATAAGAVALTAYGVSTMSEEFNTLNMVANTVLYTAGLYSAYSVYQTQAHKKAVAARYNSWDIDENRKVDRDYVYSSDEDISDDESYGYDSDEDQGISQANVLNYSRRG